MYRRNWQTRWLGLGLLAGLAWFASATPASAQTITPSLSSATLGSSTGGTTTSGEGSGGVDLQAERLERQFWRRSLGGNANLGGTTGGTQGGGNNSTTNTTVPTKINSFTPYMGSPYAAALGQNNTLTPSNSLSSSSSGTSGISNFQLLEALSATQGTIAFGNPLYPQTKGTNTGTTMGGGLGEMVAPRTTIAAAGSRA